MPRVFPANGARPVPARPAQRRLGVRSFLSPLPAHGRLQTRARLSTAPLAPQGKAASHPTPAAPLPQASSVNRHPPPQKLPPTARPSARGKAPLRRHKRPLRLFRGKPGKLPGFEPAKFKIALRAQRPPLKTALRRQARHKIEVIPNAVYHFRALVTQQEAAIPVCRRFDVAQYRSVPGKQPRLFGKFPRVVNHQMRCQIVLVFEIDESLAVFCKAAACNPAIDGSACASAAFAAG